MLFSSLMSNARDQIFQVTKAKLKQPPKTEELL